MPFGRSGTTSAGARPKVVVPRWDPTGRRMEVRRQRSGRTSTLARPGAAPYVAAQTAIAPLLVMSVECWNWGDVVADTGTENLIPAQLLQGQTLHRPNHPPSRPTDTATDLPRQPYLNGIDSGPTAERRHSFSRRVATTRRPVLPPRSHRQPPRRTARLFASAVLVAARQPGGDDAARLSTARRG